MNDCQTKEVKKGAVSPRIALLYPASFQKTPGGTELIGEFLRRTFPRIEFITPLNCTSSILYRLKVPWFGLDQVFKALAVGRFFFKRHLQEQFDAVITSGIMGLYFSFHRPRIPVINIFPASMIGVLQKTSFHGRGNRLTSRFLCLIERVVGWRKSCCITISDKEAEIIRKFYGLECAVIPNGVDLELFAPGDKLEERKLLGLPDKKMIGLFVGRPEHIKGYDIFLEVARSFPQLTFIWISPQSTETDVQNVIIRSNISHREVAQYYRAADFLIYPSRTESGMCHTILEAMASDLPLILSSDILHNFPKDADPESLGLVIDGYEKDGYLAAVGKFVAAPWRVNSRHIVQDHFSLELFSRRYKELITRLLEDNR